MTIDTDNKIKTTQVVGQDQVAIPTESTWDDFFSSTPSTTDDFMAEREMRSGREVFEALASITLPEDFPDEMPRHQTRP